VDNDIERKSCSFCGIPGQRGMKFAGGLGAMICESCVQHYHAQFTSDDWKASAARPPWHTMTDTEIVAVLPQIAHNADQVAEFLVEWVELARSRKISWAEIGKALGVSRQAVWERFAQRVEEVRARTSTA
jgi:hypothetical protein